MENNKSADIASNVDLSLTTLRLKAPGSQPGSAQPDAWWIDQCTSGLVHWACLSIIFIVHKSFELNRKDFSFSSFLSIFNE